MNIQIWKFQMVIQEDIIQDEDSGASVGLYFEEQESNLLLDYIGG